ncbi:cation:dicarboxylase symporter family transporter [Phenylobacterium sp. SCN 70-31]|uniref:dicarboxylate/amino acid:cation symporter n=1 Tax=Phenylobacterium sp. SCN 70-31 TaxID=1660129 RepID=UPI000868FAFB|nr:cation:dicarboxylase symporter family transporter [Phenylobacterium sp. SCN 70-31]ODT86972.1 MAG: sodium:dicarboxylate symporter [Phenylobacterium sp. SCN 70-31]
MKFLKTLSVQVLLALALGLAAGAAVAWGGGAGGARVVEAVEAVGGLWLNALRMTVIPLIFAVLVTGIAQVADAAATGRLAGRAVAWFAGLLAVSALTAIFLVNGLLSVWPVAEAAAAALRAGAETPLDSAATSPDFAAWVRSLAPANPVRAAAEDAVLPVVVFAVFVGFALTRLPDGRGRTLLEVFQALGDAMIVIVRWVLLAAPLGVFALALGVGLRAGAGVAGVLGQYIVVASAAGLAVSILAYLLAVTVGRVPLTRWAQATSPVLATAFATQSSLACLPAMIERSRDNLGVPPRIANLVLPLAVAIFRMTSPAVNLAVCLFVAHVYGIEPTPLQYAGAVLVALAVSVGSVGLPGQVSFIVSVAPICLALGLPIELLPILLAVEVVPDIFRTLGNVTGDMAVTAILARDEPEAAVEARISRQA